MWILFAIFPLVAIAGITAGYKLSRKKVVLPIRFVDEEDKKKILEANGLKLDENTKCSVCGETVTLENLGAVRSTPSETIFICSKSDCVNASLIISL